LFRQLPVVVAGCLLVSAHASAETKVTPSWLEADPAARAVLDDVVAAFNENNSNWNFNGYHSGDATLRLPRSCWRTTPSPAANDLGKYRA
jgi:hypothetical protein